LLPLGRASEAPSIAPHAYSDGQSLSVAQSFVQ
jgi:hypothetical protein